MMHLVRSNCGITARHSRNDARTSSVKNEEAAVLHPGARLLYAVAPAAGHDSVGHAECAARVPAILEALEARGLDSREGIAELDYFEPADLSLLLPVHNKRYLNKLEHISSTTSETVIVESAPTYVTATTYRDAVRAAGAVVALVDEIVTASKLEPTSTPVGFAIARPPGHHAVPSSAMGFCLVNNAAVAARYAQTAHNLQRVAIFDFDVHVGNGTSDVFENDPSVLFVSTHQDGSYPNTGKLANIGVDEGEGYTINIPLPGLSGDTAAIMAFDDIVEPALRRFKPDIIIISAGFDAHFADPLAGLQYRNKTYHTLTTRLMSMSKELCQGRLLMILEGGYDLVALGESVANVFEAVLQEKGFESIDPAILIEEPIDKVRAVLQEVKTIHSL